MTATKEFKLPLDWGYYWRDGGWYVIDQDKNKVIGPFETINALSEAAISSGLLK